MLLGVCVTRARPDPAHRLDRPRHLFGIRDNDSGLAWLHNFRRLVVRYERRVDIYRAFVHVACMLIALRRF